MKFSTKLSSAILFTGIISLIIFSCVLFRFSSDEVIKSQFSQTKSIATEVANDLDHLLSEKVKTALTLANTPILKNVLEMSNFFYGNFSDEKRAESIKLLNKQWKSTKDPNDNFIQKFTDNKASHLLKNQQTLLKDEYGEIFLTNKFGALVASTAKLSTFAHGHKYWWLGSYNNGVGAIFFDDRGYDESVGGYVLGLVVPIRKDKEVIGILKCNLNILGNVSKLILGAEDKLIGKFKLIRSGGMVVFEEGFEPLSTQIHNDIFQKINNNNNEMFIVNDSGGKYLVGLSEVNMTKEKKGYGFGGTFESLDHQKGNTGESWYILCYRNVSLARAPIIASMKWGVIVGIVIILILVLVSRLFAKNIARPLLMLDKATRKIGKGDFEYRIELSQKDEFGNLANSFNSMTTQLHQTTTSIELLEKEIIERKNIEIKLQSSSQHLSESLKEKETLLSEIHHRVKNNLQVIVSLLRLQSGATDDTKYTELLKKSENRVLSMAIVHEQIYQSGNFDNIGADEYITTLVNNLFISNGIDTNRIALHIECANTVFDIDNAIPCGLIINELVSNCVKHAFPNGQNGKIDISFLSTNNDEFELTVGDNGVGLPKDLNIRDTESMGLQVVRALTEDTLEGKIKLDRTKGTKFNFKFKNIKYKSRF
jgi:two-component sensor histidine kinase/HAMP domain-containing protein